MAATGDTLGRCMNSLQQNIDAAFCNVTNPSYRLTNRIKGLSYSDTLSTTLDQPYTGIGINGIGAFSKMYGRVINHSFDIYYNINGKKELVFPDVIITDFTSEQGDSGGLIYTLNKNLNYRTTVGIIMGNYPYSASPEILPTNCCVVCKAYRIENLFNVRRY